MERTLTKPRFVKLESLTNCLDGYNVYVKVVEVEVTESKDNTFQMCRAVLADETGAANAFFKGENAKLIKKGETIAIRNGKIKLIKGHISLELDIFGRLTKEDVDIKENVKNNISEQEITKRPRKQRNSRSHDNDRKRRSPRRRNNEDRNEDRERRNDNRGERRNEDRERRNEGRQERNEGRQERNEGRNERRNEDRERKHEDRERKYDEGRTRKHEDKGEWTKERKNEDRERKFEGRNDRKFDNRDEKRNFNRRNEDDRERKPIKWTKIGAIEPGDDDLNLFAKVISVDRVGRKVRVMLGDETGMIKGFFFDSEAVEVDKTVVIFKGEAIVVKEHIELQLMDRGKVDTARRTVADVEEGVNISAKAWVLSEN